MTFADAQARWDNVADLPDDSCPTCERGLWCEDCQGGTEDDEQMYEFSYKINEQQRKVGRDVMTAQKVRVRISDTIFNEYVIRDMPSSWCGESAGWCETSIEEARAMLADAEYQIDKDGPDETPAGIRTAYRHLAEQLRKSLRRVVGL